MDHYPLMMHWCSRQCADSLWKEANEGKCKSVHWYLRLHPNLRQISEGN